MAYRRSRYRLRRRRTAVRRRRTSVFRRRRRVSFKRKGRFARRGRLTRSRLTYVPKFLGSTSRHFQRTYFPILTSANPASIVGPVSVSIQGFQYNPGVGGAALDNGKGSWTNLIPKLVDFAAAGVDMMRITRMTCHTYPLEDPANQLAQSFVHKYCFSSDPTGYTTDAAVARLNDIPTRQRWLGMGWHTRGPWWLQMATTQGGSGTLSVLSQHPVNALRKWFILADWLDATKNMSFMGPQVQWMPPLQAAQRYMHYINIHYEVRWL